MFTERDDPPTWQDLFSVPYRWKLSEKEKQLLGENGQREYNKKVEEYCSAESSGACYCLMVIAPIAMISSLALLSFFIDTFKPNTSLGFFGLILASSTIVITTSLALSALIGKYAKTYNRENPKDWKNMILNQNASQKDNSLEINRTK